MSKKVAYWARNEYSIHIHFGATEAAVSSASICVSPTQKRKDDVFIAKPIASLLCDIDGFLISRGRRLISVVRWGSSDEPLSQLAAEKIKI